MAKQKTKARALFENYHALKERAYAGNLDSLCELVDFGAAIKLANLSAKQLKAVELVYFEDLTQEKACVKLGITQQGLAKHIAKAEQRVDEWLECWAHKDELEAI